MELGQYNQNSILLPFITERANSLILGRPLSGKTELLLNLALQDIYNGLPVVFIDTQDSAEILLKYIPNSRQKDVLYIAPHEQPFALNILAHVPTEQHALYASTILRTIKSVWRYNIATPTLDQYWIAGIQTLLAVPNSNLYSFKRLLTDKDYRTNLDIKDTLLKDFWKDFEDIKDKDKRQEVSSTLNKLWQFLFFPAIRNCLLQSKNRLSFKDKIVIVSLKDSQLGENGRLLGALILSYMYVLSFKGLKTTLYIDGLDRFGQVPQLFRETGITTVSTLGYLSLLPEDQIASTLATVDQIIAFRSSIADGERLEAEFNIRPQNTKLHELDPFKALHTKRGLSTEIQTVLHTFSETELSETIKRRCASQYTAPLSVIEKQIRGMV